ncbi:MAG: hypothetical protein WCR06_02385 [bacterium]
MQPFIRILLRIAITVSSILLVTGVGSVFLPKYRMMCGLENRCHSLRGRVEAKQRDIHQIRENQGRLLSDPEFVARIAHQNRRVFPNELVFVFEDKQPQ